MHPELVLGDVRNQNYTTDIYALGILFLQVACPGVCLLKGASTKSFKTVKAQNSCGLHY